MAKAKQAPRPWREYVLMPRDFEAQLRAAKATLSAGDGRRFHEGRFLREVTAVGFVRARSPRQAIFFRFVRDEGLKPEKAYPHWVAVDRSVWLMYADASVVGLRAMIEASERAERAVIEAEHEAANTHVYRLMDAAAVRFRKEAEVEASTKAPASPPAPLEPATPRPLATIDRVRKRGRPRNEHRNGTEEIAEARRTLEEAEELHAQLSFAIPATSESFGDRARRVTRKRPRRRTRRDPGRDRAVREHEPSAQLSLMAVE